MKKGLVLALALLFAASTSSLVLAQGTSSTPGKTPKKDHKKSHHNKNKNTGSTATSSAPTTTK